MGSDVISAVRDAIEIRGISAEVIVEPLDFARPVAPLEGQALPNEPLVDVTVDLHINGCPYELSHRLFIRTDRGAWPLLGLGRPTDDVLVFQHKVQGWEPRNSPLTTGWGMHPLAGFASESADLILRPDFDAARIQWMRGLCGEEIVFEDIPIQWRTRPPIDDAP